MQTFSLPATRMTKASIKRVGIVVKPHQPDALKTVCAVVEWLGEREHCGGWRSGNRSRSASSTKLAVRSLH